MWRFIMRLFFVLLLFAASATLARTQPPPKPIDKTPQPRYGVAVKLKTYPQDTPRKALASAVDAVEKGDTAYLVAHLLDPGFVEFRLSERAKQFEASVELELARLRDFQLANRDRFAPEDRLPTDRVQFEALIQDRSRQLAFRQLIRDVQDKLLDDPQAIKDLRKILRDGVFADEPGGTKATHPDVKNKVLFLRKIDDRFFLENRQEDTPKKAPGM
jgi:hypothetical protein